MSKSVSLRDVPGKFLDQRKWRALRKFTSHELIALTYINAPYPDEENPENFFWDGSGSAEDAIRCYHTGRSLLQQCRYFSECRAIGSIRGRPEFWQEKDHIRK
jgi:hypothetical protein